MPNSISFPSLAEQVTARGVPAADLAPGFFGYSLNLLLAGILIVQVYIYHLAFPTDSWTTKTTVYSVLVLELLQTALQIHDSYQTNVQHWGDPTTLDSQHLNWFAIPIITAMTAAIVQSSFAWRIRVLSNSLVWSSIVWVMAAIQLGAGLAQGILSAPLAVHELFRRTKPTIILWGASTALNDVLIAALLSFYLTRMKSSFAETNSIVTRIVSLIVGSGVLTAVWAIIIVILYFLSPQEFAMFTNVISKCYSNSLMVMLNQRIDLRDPSKKTFHSYQQSGALREDTTFHLASIPNITEGAGDISDSWEGASEIGKRAALGMSRSSAIFGEDVNGRKIGSTAV
ncbi:hypothetical protein DL96DRAFT_1631209 [Flagelloscypha sp. PMI_526]|nr:hypothetical protein DL96DRAFT_1631209 [Flagelloscypha sp. PMI_526]